MRDPLLSRPRVGAWIVTLGASFVWACSGSSGTPNDDHHGTGSDAAGSKESGAGVDSGSTTAEASSDGKTSDTSVAETGSGTSEGAPDEGIFDAGMPEALEGEGGLMVTWTEGCWYETGGMQYQAMQFTVESKTPLPLEGTLFYNATCDPSDGTDNLNDTGGTTPSGSWLFWFIHHPGEKNTSAIWSYGGIKSACINYNVAPDC
jgi:hypothetical protein